MGDSEKKCWVGFDLGGTKMMAVVFDDDFKVLGRERRKTKAQNGVKVGLERIAETIMIAAEDAKIKPSDIIGIGIACPGPLDLNEGVMLESPNLGWKNAALKETLEKAFKCDVVVMNDVDAGVYGEYRYGAARDARCVFGIFPGTGIGGGCVYDGKIIRGKKSSAMEIGHCQVQPGGQACGCGNKGCLETVASRLAIATQALAAAYRGEAPYLLEHSSMNLDEIKSSMLADSIKAGDKAVEKIVIQAAKWLGVGISIAVNMIAPDVVVLGGGLVEAMPEIYLREAENSARKRVLPTFEDTFKVVAAKLGDDAASIGAAAYARDILTKEEKGKNK